MSAGIWDIVIEQGAVFRRELTWTDENGDPVNLDYFVDARMQVRRNKDKNSTLFTEFLMENDGIGFGPNGKIYLYKSASDTAALDFSQAFYDIELIPANPEDTIRFLEGTVSLSSETTDDYES